MLAEIIFLGSHVLYTDNIGNKWERYMNLSMQYWNPQMSVVDQQDLLPTNETLEEQQI